MDKSTIYKAHWNKSDFNKVFLKFKKFLLEADVDFLKRCSEILSKTSHENNLDVLEIGVGDGSVSLAFLKQLAVKKKINKYLGIEISPQLVKILKSKTRNFEEHANKVDFKLEDATTFKSNDSFDLIVGFNSWYGIPFEKIKDYLLMLKEGGTLAILLNSKENITIDLTRRFVEPIYFSEDLTNWLDGDGIKYTKHRLISNLVSKKDFVLKNEVNPKAEFFYRYLLRKIEGRIDNVFSYLSKKSGNYFSLPQDLLIIRKNKKVSVQ